MIKYKGILIVLSLACVALADRCVAQDQVMISEVQWAGSVSSAVDEWLELTNSGAEAVDVSGWSLWNVVGEPKEQLRITKGEISGHSSFLIANNGPDHQFSGGSSTLAVTPDVIASGLSLSNSSLKLELRNAAGEVVDRVGDGSKPAAGSTDPVASMERLAGQPGTGTDATDWRTSTDQSGIDAGIVQFGTPTSSGRSQTSTSPVVRNTPDSSPVATTAVPGGTLEALVRGSLSGLVRIEAQVIVLEQYYKARTIILADGEWSAELLLPESSSLRLEQGDVVELVGKVSTSSTPRLLLSKDTDLLVISSRSTWTPLALEHLESPRLFQLIRLTGRARPVRGSVEVIANGQTIKVTRRQGVVMPEIQIDDTVSVTGLVVAEDPLAVRVLEDGAVTVIATTTESESVTDPESATELELAETGSDSLVADDSAEQPADDVDQVTDASLSVLTDVSEAIADQPMPSSRVLGAINFQNADAISRISLVVAIGSLCAILLILGDSVWIYLKQKQLQ